MFSPVGEAQIEINLDFIAKALTEQGHAEETITKNQFFKITSFEILEENNHIIFDCTVFEQILN